MSENDDPALLGPGYALGILTPEESAAYEAYLASSAPARNESRANDETAALLGLDADAITPPARLKANLMAQLAVTPQLPSLQGPSPQTTDAATAADTPAPAATPVAPAATAVAGPVEAAAHRRWFAKPTTVLVAAAAAVLLFVGGAVVGGTLVPRPSVEQQQASALAQINSAPDAQRASAEVANGGRATLIWSGSLGTSALLIDGLGTLPHDKTYELWYIRGTKAVSAGTFNASADATSWRVLKGTMQAGDTVGVTVEPAGGSEQPTTQPIVAIRS
ncbi:anti-sigma factor [Leifsonia sp. Root112D2]|uniref:anti-sigma factor n=1 Tax=Leifsonia sp. Root112D2 TaxID=1736426 RepID=UPI0006F7E73E|nr:anti-sigma factor [Leifsonia sp. Root112D2]KQV07582.1 hypothetical protein ASC63_10080 [Leifsonia sp. Root112D2]